MQNENAQCRMQNAECAMNQVLLCALSIAHCALLVQQHDETARYGCESAPNYTGKKKGATPQFHVVALLESARFGTLIVYDFLQRAQFDGEIVNARVIAPRTRAAQQ